MVTNSNNKKCRIGVFIIVFIIVTTPFTLSRLYFRPYNHLTRVDKLSHGLSFNYRMWCDYSFVVSQTISVLQYYKTYPKHTIRSKVIIGGYWLRDPLPENVRHIELSTVISTNTYSRFLAGGALHYSGTRIMWCGDRRILPPRSPEISHSTYIEHLWRTTYVTSYVVRFKNWVKSGVLTILDWSNQYALYIPSVNIQKINGALRLNTFEKSWESCDISHILVCISPVRNILCLVVIDQYYLRDRPMDCGQRNELEHPWFAC